MRLLIVRLFAATAWSIAALSAAAQEPTVDVVDVTCDKASGVFEVSGPLEETTQRTTFSST